LVSVRNVGLGLLVAALLACDPAYMKRFPVDDSSATASIEHVLTRFEAEHLEPGFSRLDDPAFVVDGYRVIRTYSRDSATASNDGHHVRLQVLVHAQSSEIVLAPFAFPSFSEPADLRALREALSHDLCKYGYRVKGVCGG
jgi:hypothetical protein